MNLPGAIERAPGLDRWLHINIDGSITVNTGKVEIGQGIMTAIAMIAAEELDVVVERIHVQTADTRITPNEQITAGSMSVEDSGSAVRVASAAAREILLAKAAEFLDVAPGTLTVDDGMISSTESNEQIDYWSLQAGMRFETDIVSLPAVKDPRHYRIVGHAVSRVDLPAKLKGDVAFVHDMLFHHLRHGRLVKPPQPDARLLECPDTLEMPGVEIVRDGSFLGVLAAREEIAVAAAERLALRCRWSQAPLTVMPGEIPDYLRNKVVRSLPVVDGTPVDAPVPAYQSSVAVTVSLEATYYRPYQMHASMGPSAAVAQYANGILTVYSHSQGVELLKRALADVLGLPKDQVDVIHAEGAGCYGHNGADDVALDAALLAMAAEPDPVSVKWTRADEHGFEPYAPAAVIDMKAGLDKDGRVIDWRHESFSFSHAGRPRPSPGYTNLQSAWWREQAAPPAPRQPAMFKEVGIHRNLQPIYEFPQQQLIKHFVASSPLRTSSLRSLGAFANVFAIESFMDELAQLAGADVFEFRLRHLQDTRARKVLELLRDQLAAPSDEAGVGRGIALARYKNRQTWCAVAVDLVVSDDAQVQLRRATIAADAGLVVDPDGLINQLEGGFVQAASWALKEAVSWDESGVTSRDWLSYPILRFSEVPEIETHLVPSRDRALGVGEASTGPTPAAIANAIFAASGTRVRAMPFTPEVLRAAAARQ